MVYFTIEDGSNTIIIINENKILHIMKNGKNAKIEMDNGQVIAVMKRVDDVVKTIEDHEIIRFHDKRDRKEYDRILDIE